MRDYFYKRSSQTRSWNMLKWCCVETGSLFKKAKGAGSRIWVRHFLVTTVNYIKHRMNFVPIKCKYSWLRFSFLPWIRRSQRTSLKAKTSPSTRVLLKPTSEKTNSSATFYLWPVQTVRCGSRDRRCRWCRCFPARPSQPACCRSEVHKRKATHTRLWVDGWTLQTDRTAVATNHLLHAVVHGQQRLQPLPLQHVGELHVDGLHWACVTHDPVLVQVWCVVVARGADETKEMETRLFGWISCVISFHLVIAVKKKHKTFV